MRLDIDECFRDLIRESNVADHLSELQECLRPRDNAQQWARNLRFIVPATAAFDPEARSIKGSDDTSEETCICSYWSSSDKTQYEDVLKVTAAHEFTGCNHYVAVSWVWQDDSPPRGAVDAPETYFIAGNAGRRESAVPRHVLSRAISFAAYYEVPHVWFDKECIGQSDPIDQELGIQSMDIVYQRSLYPLGLLQTFIQTQEQLDVVTQLVEGVTVRSEQLPVLLDVLRLIEQDKWFTRAWILQESVSGGFEMSLLIQHDPMLFKSDVLGRIKGEIETTISEFTNAIHFAYACVSLCDDPIGSVLEAQLIQAIEHILSYMPTVIAEPPKGFDDPDYRQTCNAAQALTYLQPRMNGRIADRLAILGNLCNYALRLDTNMVENLGYDFSICAFALSIFNGDLSLTRAENPTRGPVLGFAWGPQSNFRLSELKHFEDDDDVVRAAPAKLVRNGLLVTGWLWKVESILTDLETKKHEVKDEDGLGDPDLLIWRVLKRLLREGFFHLADLIWYRTSKRYFGTERDQARGSPATPASLSDVLDFRTGKLIFHNSTWVRDETDFRAFFKPSTPDDSDPRSIAYRESTRHWEYNRWFWTMLRRHGLPLAKLVNHDRERENHTNAHPCATFEVNQAGQALDAYPHAARVPTSDYVFHPATVLDDHLVQTQRRNAPTFWLGELGVDRDAETGHRVLRGIGEMCRGYYRIPKDMVSELFVFR